MPEDTEHIVFEAVDVNTLNGLHVLQLGDLGEKVNFCASDAGGNAHVRLAMIQVVHLRDSLNDMIALHEKLKGVIL